MHSKSIDRRIARLTRECNVDAAVPLLLAVASAFVGASLLSSAPLDAETQGQHADQIAVVEGQPSR